MDAVCIRDADDLAKVYLAELDDGSAVEFVESTQPPLAKDQKWVIIVSTLKGCPVKCPICDAGGNYGGRLSADEIIAQIDHVIAQSYPDRVIPVKKLKIQFARMGDPAFNPAVLEVLSQLPTRFDAPGLMPCISSVAPAGRDAFFEQLIDIKRRLYGDGSFQMQFSVHTTCDLARRELVPIRTWNLAQMAAFGDRFFDPRDRKITLNFAPIEGFELDPSRLEPLFSPERFAIKLTPVNPTENAQKSGLTGLIDPDDEAACREVQQRFEVFGYDTILSIGELEENQIGSNCGMYVTESKKNTKNSKITVFHQTPACTGYAAVLSKFARWTLNSGERD